MSSVGEEVVDQDYYLYVLLIPGDNAFFAYYFGSLLFVLGIIFLVLFFILPRAMNQSYVAVSRLKKENRLE